MIHTEVQGWLRDLGSALGFDVWVASNDRGREYAGGRLGEGCLPALPDALTQATGAETIPLIDVLWLERGEDRVVAAFEVEHTTSIASGILRLLDLASVSASVTRALFLVAPDDREDDVRKQLGREAFRAVAGLRPRYLAYGDLARNREHMARFGEGLRAVEAVARDL